MFEVFWHLHQVNAEEHLRVQKTNENIPNTFFLIPNFT